MGLFDRLRDWISCADWLPNWFRLIFTGILGHGGDNFEVERKYPLKSEERDLLPAKLLEMGFKHVGQVYMHDHFLPTDDEEDMLRVRDETMDDRTKHLLTRKSWVLVAGERERKETEEEITLLMRESLLDLGLRAHGRKLPNFTKERDMYSRQDKTQSVTVTIDNVDGLGTHNGFYLEVEILVNREADVVRARSAVEELAQEILGEKREFAISYMKMLKQHLATL